MYLNNCIFYIYIMELSINNKDINNENIINEDINNDLFCISVKNKKKVDVRCNCKKIFINGEKQLFCGKHLKTKYKILFKNNINKSFDNKSYDLYELETIPECNECNIIKLFNTLDYYKIKYKKDESFINLYNKLKKKLDKYRKYKNNIKLIINIQKNIRKYLIYRLKKSINKEDFYTLDNIYFIPLKYIYLIKDEKNITYCFDIRSLYKYIEINKEKIINPFKNIPFTDIEINNINKKIKLMNKKDLILEKDIISPRQYFKQYLIKVFQKYDSFGYLTNIEWFSKLSFSQIKELYKKCEDIWNYRATLTAEQKNNIVQGGKLFTTPLKIIYKMNISKDLELRKIILNEFDKAISQGITNADKNHGAILMLTGFAEVSDDVRNSFPWLIQ